MTYKFIIGIGIILLGFFLFFIANYHFTIQGAWDELEKKEDGTIISTNEKEDGTAFIIHQNGSISFAIAYHTDIIVFYKDFIIYPTNLNINDKPSLDEFQYSKVKGYGANYELRIGFTINPNVLYKYTITDKNEIKNIKEYGQRVIDLEKYSNQSSLKGVKIFTHYKSDVDFQLFDRNLTEVFLTKVQK